MSIYQRVIAACGALVFVAVLAIGFTSSYVGKKMLLDSIYSRLDAVATNQRDKVNGVVKAWQDRVALIASRTQLRISLKRFWEKGDDADLTKVRKIIEDARKSVPAVEYIAVGATQGNPIVSTSGAESINTASMISLNAQERQIKLTHMSMDQAGHLYAHIQAPMVLDGEPIGLVYVTLRADELIMAAQDYTGLGETGETILIAMNRRGENQYLHPLRHDKTAALKPGRLLEDGEKLQTNFDTNSGRFPQEMTDYRGANTLGTVLPLGDINGIVLVKMDKDEILAPVTEYQKIILWAVVIFSLIAIVIGLRIAHAIATPVVKLAAKSQRIRLGEHHLRATVSPTQAKEINELAICFNSLADSLLNANAELEQRVAERTQALETLNDTLEQRIESRTQALKTANLELETALQHLRTTQAELVESEKMAALGGLVAGVAHEINTPIGIAVTGVSYLKDAVNDINTKFGTEQITRGDLKQFIDNATQTCDLMTTQLNRAAVLVSDFKQVAVDQSNPDYRGVNLYDYLEKIVATLQPQFKKTPHQIKMVTEKGLDIQTCPGALAQVLTALVNNALVHAFDENDEFQGEVIITAEKIESICRIQVSDNGKGVDAENQSRLFEPFYTTKRGAGGSGLGLSISHNIVTDILRGIIHCVSKPGQGAHFIIDLPLLAEMA